MDIAIWRNLRRFWGRCISNWENILLVIGFIIWICIIFNSWESIWGFFQRYVEVIPEKKDRLQLWQIMRLGIGVILQSLLRYMTIISYEKTS